VWNLLLPADADAFINQLDLNPQPNHEMDVYWARLWPTALTMSTLLPQFPCPAGAKVLELGCGIGLIGLAALAVGYRVTFTDYMPIAVELAMENAERNGFTSFEGFVLDWNHPRGEPFDGIVASDVLYDQRNHAAVLSVLDAMLRPAGSAWIGDPGRYHVESFIEVAWERGFDVALRNELGQFTHELTPGEFRLLEIRRCQPGISRE
jgi:predicted nicotinamide N-methyase